MTRSLQFSLLGALLAIAIGWVANPAAQTATVAIDADDIGGVVRSARGPEAGVWVIAETNDLGAGFRKIVVTDDEGRYVVPDLPKAKYQVWVRGYGLADSPKVAGAPGGTLNLTAVVAPSPQVAAQVYPANYWYSLLRLPPRSTFPLQGTNFETLEAFVHAQKSGAMQLNQMGDPSTRYIPEVLGRFETSQEAWRAWLNSGESPVGLGGNSTKNEVAPSMYAAWTDRVARGDVPPVPTRPAGVERNLVITQWDWSNEKGFTHDVVSTDRRDPTVNANGPVYSVEQHTADVMNVVDPVRNTVWRVDVPVKDPKMPMAAVGQGLGRASLTWGEEIIRPSIATLHNPMIDQKGRVWITAQFRMGDNQPAFCKAGSQHPSAKYFPIDRNFAVGSQTGREVVYYEPATKKFTFVELCFGTHHLNFSPDPDHTLWFSGGRDVIGYLKTKVLDDTGDEARAQGWMPYIIDTNGNGKPDPWVEPDQPVDPAKDKRVTGSTYGLVPHPLDGSVWGGISGFPGRIIRLAPGSNPPETALAEIYEPPLPGFNTKSVDIDSKGNVWVALSSSGHLARFDRSKCKVLNGPSAATGKHCPEGWTIHKTPGPTFEGESNITTDFHYLNWVDQFDTLGLGKDVPMLPGTNSDSVVAFLPNEQKFVVLRVPYPLGFYSRGMDGRIDDPKAGWKGRGLWANYGGFSPWRIEGGKGQTGKVLKMQIRPDPLAH